MKRFLWILPALTACSEPIPQLPDDATVVQRVALHEVIDGAMVTGVTVNRDTGEIVVIDAAKGLFTITGQRIADRSALSPGWEVESFTDVVSLGDGQFALTVRNDGLLFDANTGTTTQYFCYLPGWMDETFVQLTNSLAFDEARGRLIAQPQTYNNNEITDAEVAEFTLDGGQPTGWHRFKTADFSAGGIAVDGDGLLMAQDSILYSYDYGDNEPSALVDLNRLGIDRVEGLALTTEGNLLLIDGEDQELVEIAGWR